MEHPKDIGDRSTLAIMLALRQVGFHVSVPFGENTRNDLVLDDGERLARVQCKTGRLRNGSVLFNTASSYAHHPNAKVSGRHYQGEVEYFAVYCGETAGVYLVPIADLSPLRKAMLRVDSARNNQSRGIRPAADYEIGRVAIERLRAPSGAR
jgi:hypothetical protein